MQKNVIFITTDQHRFDCIAANGNTIVKTPNLDRLVRMGVNFQNHYCSHPTCSPARASMMTGRYARSHGLFALGYRLPDDQVPHTLQEILAQQGYDTSVVGKVHLEALEAKDGENLDYSKPYFGFRKFKVTEDDPCGEYMDWIRQNHPQYEQAAAQNACPSFAPKPYGHPRNEGEVPEVYTSPLPEELHQTAWITQHALEYIDQASQADAPFFAWFSYVDPHHPWNPPASYADLYDPASIPLPDLTQLEMDADTYDYAYIPNITPENYQKMIAAYYALITYTDAYIGKVLDHLEAKGLLENTLIVFTADHGDYNADHGLIRKLWRLYDGVSRAPLIVYDPENPTPGRTVSGYTQDVDFCPTVLDLCGIKAPFSMEGQSFANAVLGEATTKRTYAVTEFTMDNHPFGEFNWSLALVQDQHKLCFYPFENKFYLFDLLADPQENVNCFGNEAYAAIQLKLQQSLLHWQCTTPFYMRPKTYRW